ncbi:MAG: ribonuclease III [Deltaproteobacteria bacterium]|nr:ribonuclease III [Deltaproteobacteria bacterium]
MNFEEILRAAGKALGYEFKNPELFRTAITHRSYSGDNQGFEHNEKLEFLGDAVLDLAIASLLMEKFTEEDEGILTKRRANLVNQEFLAEKATSLGIGDWLLIGKGEEISGGREKPSLLSDCFEAILGAIYLESGYDTALNVCTMLFSDDLESNDDSIVLSGDYKSALQEYTQSTLHTLPVYEFAGTRGPEHDQLFMFRIILQGSIIAEGVGPSKKKAQQKAAENALVHLTSNDINS